MAKWRWTNEGWDNYSKMVAEGTRQGIIVQKKGSDGYFYYHCMVCDKRAEVSHLECDDHRHKVFTNLQERASQQQIQDIVVQATSETQPWMAQASNCATASWQ